MNKFQTNINHSELKHELWNRIVRLDDENENVSKFVFTKPDAVSEAVLYRYPTYDERTVICCSVQSGCPVGCVFCGTGDNFVRNLTVDEILSQPILALEEIEKNTGIKPQDIKKLQIMTMSMGEPMLNMKRLIEALEKLHELYPNADLLVSTSAPDVNYEPFFDLSERIDKVGLQFSIHESTDIKRDLLIPFNKKLNLENIAKTGEEWARRSRRKPFFNYCVHSENCSQEDVDNLLKLFNPAVWEATVSVICEKDETVKAAHERQAKLVEDFLRKMTAAGYSTRAFNPAGQDTIGGGCGQLFHTQRWFKENPKQVRSNRRK